MIDSAPSVRPWNALLKPTRPDCPRVGAAAAGDLQRAFHRLGAAVGEEHARHAAVPQQQLGQADLRLLREVVRDVDVALRLRGDGGHHARVGVAQGVDGDAGEQVQVAACRRPCTRYRPSPRHGLERQALVSVEEGGLFAVVQVMGSCLEKVSCINMHSDAYLCKHHEHPTEQPLRVAVIGASGYSGGELLRLLAPDPDITVEVATAHAQAGRPVGDVHPFLAGRLPLTLTPFDAEALEGLDCVFIALPSGEAMQIVPVAAGQGRLRHRPGRRPAPADRGALRAVLPQAAHGAAPAGRGGLRAAGTEPRAHPRREADREPGLLPDRRHPGPAAGAEGRARADRGHRHQLAVGRVGRRPQQRTPR